MEIKHEGSGKPYGTELKHESNGKLYGFEVKDISPPNWEDSGFRHRVVCDDGRKSGWADYTTFSFLDDVVCVTPYFHDATDMSLVSLRMAMSFIAVGEVIEGVNGDVTVYPADDEIVALQELSEIPTHIWFPGKKLAARVPFEMCWKIRPSEIPEGMGKLFNENPSFASADGNCLGFANEDGTPNEFGSCVIPLGDRILVNDPASQFWGAGETLEKAIAAMPNNMEELPYICEVYTGPASLYVNENGVVKTRDGSAFTCLFSKRNKLIYPKGAR